MKRMIKIILAAGIAMAMVLSLAGCGNMQMVDLTYTYNTAVIEMPGGEALTIEVESWKDYEDCDQLQIKSKEGTTYLVHSSKCVMMT